MATWRWHKDYTDSTHIFMKPTTPGRGSDFDGADSTLFVWKLTASQCRKWRNYCCSVWKRSCIKRTTLCGYPRPFTHVDPWQWNNNLSLLISHCVAAATSWRGQLSWWPTLRFSLQMWRGYGNSVHEWPNVSPRPARDRPAARSLYENQYSQIIRVD
jgi:hypothetical protein